MQKPNLDKMWETFIRMPVENNVTTVNAILDTLRFKIYPLVSHLCSNGVIDWYCFLIHDRNSGVPTPQDDNNAYFHIRVSLKEDVKPDSFLKSLTDYCIMTRQVNRDWVKEISVDNKGNLFDKSMLKSESIEDIWRIIGEQSELLLDMLSVYKDNVKIPLQYIGLFFHYYFNMTQLLISCPNCGKGIRL